MALHPDLDPPGDIAVDPDAEWLEADAVGTFASGTVGGPRTRRYHALVMHARHPPAGRLVLVNGLDAEVTTPAGTWPISAQAGHLTASASDLR